MKKVTCTLHYERVIECHRTVTVLVADDLDLSEISDPNDSDQLTEEFARLLDEEADEQMIQYVDDADDGGSVQYGYVDDVDADAPILGIASTKGIAPLHKIIEDAAALGMAALFEKYAAKAAKKKSK